MTPEFFADVRKSVFGGKLKQEQVDGLNKIVRYGVDNGYSRPDLAYVLASAYWETAGWMQPIREGAARSGPTYTDAQARRAVAGLYSKGLIRWNYAKPNAAGQSFYGRGLIQITHEENYAKMIPVTGVDLVCNPDQALEWVNALPILFIGMRDGMFRKQSLADVPDVMASPAFTAAHRGIVNGDARKNGLPIAQIAGNFWTALETVYG